MATIEQIEENWYRRADVFELIHYLSQYGDSGLNSQELLELRGKGTLDEVEDILEALRNKNVVKRDGSQYSLDFSAFHKVAEERWIESLSDKQRQFIDSFSRNFIDDREHGTVRRMLTKSMIQGVFEKRKQMDEEIIDLAKDMNYDEESYDRSGIYAELAMREI